MDSVTDEDRAKLNRVLVGFTTPVYLSILEFAQPAVVRLMVERRVVLHRQDAPEPEPPDTTEFEEWLLARWLRDVRSDEFRDSVQYERLMAEWERGGS